MFLRVVLEIAPEVVGERVFLRHVRVEDARELRALGGEFRELEVARLAEADEEDAFAVLRHHAARVDDAVINVVAQRLGQGVVNDFKGAALVVADAVLHVLQHERLRAVEVDDVGKGEEKVALFHVLEAVLATEAVLLGDAREAEGLAGKAAAEDVELGNVGHGHGVDVAVRGLAEVRGVGLPAELVPVAGEDTTRARPLEGEAEPADAAEQINEAERRGWPGRGDLVPGEAGRSVHAIRRRVFAQHWSAALLSRSTPRSRTRCGFLRSSPPCSGLLRVGRPALLSFAAQASAPLHNSAVVKPRALAKRATFLMPGFLSPRSMPEM